MKLLLLLKAELMLLMQPEKVVRRFFGVDKRKPIEEIIYEEKW
jgi:hypothetical protein